jgi:hypothetical protein
MQTFIIELLESKLELKNSIENLLKIKISEIDVIIIKDIVLKNIKEEEDIKSKYNN